MKSENIQIHFICVPQGKNKILTKGLALRAVVDPVREQQILLLFILTGRSVHWLPFRFLT